MPLSLSSASTNPTAQKSSPRPPRDRTIPPCRSQPPCPLCLRRRLQTRCPCAPAVLRWTLLPLPRHHSRSWIFHDGASIHQHCDQQDEVCDVVEGGREVTVGDVA